MPLLAMISGLSLNLAAQELFPVRQITSDPASEGFPAWSPGGDSIIYQHTDRHDTIGKNGLWKVALDGSGATQIFAGVAEHAKWSPDGQLVVFDADTGQNMKMVHASGGPPMEFLPDSVTIRNGGLPHWSPDGSKIAFIEGGTTSLCVYDMMRGQVRSIFHREGIVPLPGGWTPDGEQVLIAHMEMPSRKSSIWTIPLDGGDPAQITGHCENFYRHLALSPDGKYLVYACYENRSLGLYIMGLDGFASAGGDGSAGEGLPAHGKASLPLAVDPGVSYEGPVWSPDGNKIAFISTRAGNADIWVMDLDLDELGKKLDAAQTLNQ